MVDQLEGRQTRIIAKAWDIAFNVPDPEIPVLTIGDLGILREIEMAGDGALNVKLSPTYSGCPAVSVIEDNVRIALTKNGISAKIERVISPPWTSDWITDTGRKKLMVYGIAPPVHTNHRKPELFSTPSPSCPRCKGENTKLISQFGSTPCKAHYKCKNCREPFDYFKCL